VSRFLAAVRRHPAVPLWGLVAAVVLVLIALLPISWLTSTGDDVLIPGAFWDAVFFCLYYTSLIRWWRNPMGSFLVGLDAALGIVLFPDILNQEFGIALPALTDLRLTVMGLLLVNIIVLSRIFLLGRLNGWVPTFPWYRRKARGLDEVREPVTAGPQGEEQ
jgi:hypothetical protein